MFAKRSIEVQIMSSQETATSHPHTRGTLSFKLNLWFATNFSKVNLLKSNTHSFLSQRKIITSKADYGEKTILKNYVSNSEY